MVGEFESIPSGRKRHPTLSVLPLISHEPGSATTFYPYSLPSARYRHPMLSVLPPIRPNRHPMLSVPPPIRPKSSPHAIRTPSHQLDIATPSYSSPPAPLVAARRSSPSGGSAPGPCKRRPTLRRRRKRHRRPHSQGERPCARGRRSSPPAYNNGSQANGHEESTVNINGHR